MKVASAAAAILILLLALSWLAFRAVDPEAERFDRALKALDRFTVMETSLHRDVLSARAGLLRNYDPLVRELNACVMRSVDYETIPQKMRKRQRRSTGLPQQRPDRRS